MGGDPGKKKGIGLGGIILIVVVIGYLMGNDNNNENQKPQSIKRVETQRTKTPDKPREIVSNSEWDGSVSQVKKYLKRNLKDPKSYESIEWSPVVKLDTDDLQHKFIVRHKYRAKNSYGGYVIENQMFYLDQNGYVLKSMEYGQ